MNTQQAIEIHTRAMNQINAGLVSVRITAEVVEDLTRSYLALKRRLAQIRGHYPDALSSWANNNREEMRVAFVEIEELAKPVL